MNLESLGVAFIMSARVQQRHERAGFCQSRVFLGIWTQKKDDNSKWKMEVRVLVPINIIC